MLLIDKSYGIASLAISKNDNKKPLRCDYISELLQLCMMFLVVTHLSYSWFRIRLLNIYDFIILKNVHAYADNTIDEM